MRWGGDAPVVAALRKGEYQVPPWKQPRGKWMVSLVNSDTNVTSKRWHLWEIDLRFALNSTPGWLSTQRTAHSVDYEGFGTPSSWG